MAEQMAEQMDEQMDQPQLSFMFGRPLDTKGDPELFRDNLPPQVITIEMIQYRIELQNAGLLQRRNENGNGRGLRHIFDTECTNNCCGLDIPQEGNLPPPPQPPQPPQPPPHGGAGSNGSQSPPQSPYVATGTSATQSPPSGRGGRGRGRGGRGRATKRTSDQLNVGIGNRTTNQKKSKKRRKPFWGRRNGWSGADQW